MKQKILAHSLLEIKSIDDDERIIEGIATTPEVDRQDDIVEPKGAQFKLPIPFLHQHRSSEPTGHVIKATVTPEGIEVRVKFVKVDEPPSLKERLDVAWAEVKSKLVRGLSIGFQPIEWSDIKGTFGVRYTKWNFLELSAVTIPANAAANITTIKSYDDKARTASGDTRQVVRLSPPPGVSGTSETPKGIPMKTISEQLASFEAKRQASDARRTEIMTKAGEEGRTLDDKETEEYDGLAAEVKAVDEHLVRLKALEKSNIEKAAAIQPGAGRDDSNQRNANNGNGNGNGAGSYIAVKDNLPPGVEFARYARCLMVSKGNLMQAVEIAKAQYPDQPRIEMVLKAAVAAGTTTDATWAAPLVQYQQFAGDFVAFLRPQTIVGKFGENGIPSLRRVPFNITIQSQTSGGDGYWVGEGQPKPLTKFNFAATNLRWAKVANIAVITQELARFSSPSADLMIRDALRDALVQRLDIDFVNPGKAAVTNVSPASITNGLTAITSAGATIDNINTDIAAVFGRYIAANMTPSTGVWLMSATTALALSLKLNPLGQQAFPDINMNGGKFKGLPVIVSEHMNNVGGGSPTLGNMLILVNASDIYLADDGQVTIDASTEASLQMLDNPTNDSPTPTPTTVVSMFQTDSIAIRAERFINWQRRLTGAVAYIANVAY